MQEANSVPSGTPIMTIAEAQAAEGISPTTADVKNARKLLEVELARQIIAFEARYDCRVVSLRLDFDKNACGAWRTTELRADIQL